jgi:hypothetical protein
MPRTRIGRTLSDRRHERRLVLDHVRGVAELLADPRHEIVEREDPWSIPARSLPASGGPSGG